MSEFTAQIFAPMRVAAVVEALGSLAVRWVILPVRRGSIVLAPWEDWEAVKEALPECWALSYSDDGPSLVVSGYRAGRCWLHLEFHPEAGDSDFDLEELLDENGLYPDGSPGPELARQYSLDNVNLARERQELPPDLADWLRQALNGRPSVRQVMRLLPARLGFSVRRWLRPEDLEHRTREEWLAEYRGAVVSE